MESRLKKEEGRSEPGPVITISREVGCPARPVAEKLKDLLNDRKQAKTEWRCLSNEILEESARKLKVNPKYIKHIFTYNERSMLDEIMAAAKKEHRYKSDRAIKNTIGHVIRSLGEQGNFIIIGRAGVAHTRHITHSLHVRLIAPFDWRVRKIMEHKGISMKAAIDKITKGDTNRKQFLSYYLGDSKLDDNFDLLLNCNSFNINELAAIINETFNMVMMSGHHHKQYRKVQYTEG
jgi:cytidylate kinase